MKQPGLRESRGTGTDALPWIFQNSLTPGTPVIIYTPPAELLLGIPSVLYLLLPYSLFVPPATADVDVFRCTGSFNPARPEALGPAPASLAHDDAAIAATTAAEKGKGAKAAAADKGKGSKASAAAATAAGSSKGAEKEEEDEEEEPCAVTLATMDIFAGCGGLSEGMHQVRVETKWASFETSIIAADDRDESFKLYNAGDGLADGGESDICEMLNCCSQR